MAEGIDYERGSPQFSILKRTTSNGIIFIPIDIVKIAEQKQPDIYIKSNDVLIVKQTTLKYLYLQFLKLFRFSASPTTFFQ